MMSDDFCPFLSPLIRFFISAPLFIKSDLAEPPPLPSDVVYGCPLYRWLPIYPFIAITYTYMQKPKNLPRTSQTSDLSIAASNL